MNNLQSIYSTIKLFDSTDKFRKVPKMSQFETLTVYLFFAILNFIALTVSHPTTLESTVSLNNELKNIKTDINLLYKKLSELSVGTKKKKNKAR